MKYHDHTHDEDKKCKEPSQFDKVDAMAKGEATPSPLKRQNAIRQRSPLKRTKTMASINESVFETDRSMRSNYIADNADINDDDYQQVIKGKSKLKVPLGAQRKINTVSNLGMFAGT